MMKVNRGLLALLFAINVYALIIIILCKISLPQWSFIYERLLIFIADPSLIQGRLWLANFTPFRTINQLFDGGLAPIQWLNLYGNILVFIPTGVLVALWSREQRISSAVLVSFMISLMLESAQLVLSMGSFDVDDLILNTLGGLIGALSIVLMNKGISWLRSRNPKLEPIEAE